MPPTTSLAKDVMFLAALVCLFVCLSVCGHYSKSNSSSIITSLAKEVMFLVALDCLFVCLFVCLWTTLLKKLLTD